MWCWYIGDRDYDTVVEIEIVIGTSDWYCTRAALLIKHPAAPTNNSNLNTGNSLPPPQSLYINYASIYLNTSRNIGMICDHLSPTFFPIDRVHFFSCTVITLYVNYQPINGVGIFSQEEFFSKWPALISYGTSTCQVGSSQVKSASVCVSRTEARRKQGGVY